MIEKILSFCDDNDMLADTAICLVGVSGGADSMALLEVMREISLSRNFKIIAAHFNHKLRGDESERDENFVRAYCNAEKIKCYVECADVQAYASMHKLGTEEAARNLRYDFFSRTAREAGADRIATGHNANDNAETVLFNLTRGSSVAGLSGIPPIRGNIIRPMLIVTRDEICEFITKRGISHVEDSTNAQIDITRNKIRHSVIPILTEINPRFVKAATSAAMLSRADELYLSEQAEDFILKNCPDSAVSAKKLTELPPALFGRVVKKLYGGNLLHEHIKAVLSLCRNNKASARLSLPKKTVYKEYDCIVFNRGSEQFCVSGFEPISLFDGVISEICGTSLKISCKSVVFNDTICRSLTNFLFKSSDICGRLVVRPRLEGDKIKLLGRDGTKALKKLFIDKRIPARNRQLIPVIADELGVLAVYGLGVSARAVPNPGDEAIMIAFADTKIHHRK